MHENNFTLTAMPLFLERVVALRQETTLISYIDSDVPAIGEDPDIEVAILKHI